MPEQFDRNYVKRQIEIARTTDDEAIKNNCLYRAVTQIEVIPCNGQDNLTFLEQQIILAAAQELFGGDNES
jgi:hypothetical protein